MAVDVLIAEDEPSILESLDFILRRAGWTIDVGHRWRRRAGRGAPLAPARAGARRDAAQALGFEVLKQIRADQILHAFLPVLILTAKGQQQDRRIAEELGADGFVTKPYANADVVDAVRRLLWRWPWRLNHHAARTRPMAAARLIGGIAGPHHVRRAHDPAAAGDAVPVRRTVLRRAASKPSISSRSGSS